MNIPPHPKALSQPFSVHRSDIGLLLIRLMLATVFLYHGSQKLFGVFDGPGLTGFSGWLGSLGIPLPYFSAFAAAASEFLGGIALLGGLWLRWTAWPVALTMLVAAFSAHQGFDGQSGGMEYPLTLALMMIALGLLGSGRYSLPQLLSRKYA